jgi:hypothetical protein
MKTLIFLIILGCAGWFAIKVIREGDVPRALVAALDVAPPLKLEYEAKIFFGLWEYLHITNTSDKPVHPSKVLVTKADGATYSITAPSVIKEHETVKLRLLKEGKILNANIVIKKGDRIQVTCVGFPVPRSLTFVD